MAKWCPIVKRPVVYLECLECEDKRCEEDLEIIHENEKYFEKRVDKQ